MNNLMRIERCTSHILARTRCNAIKSVDCQSVISHRLNQTNTNTNTDPNANIGLESKTSTNLTIITESPFAREGSWLKKLGYKLGISQANIFALRRASIFHYEACTDKLDPVKFFTQFQMADTLFSFYLVIQLHVWMCQVRSMREGSEGRVLRNEIVDRMWQDLDTRLSKIEVFSSKRRQEILGDLLFHFQGAMYSYDEGLLSDDKTLANALWRTLFCKGEVDPRAVELAVKYVRTQMDHLRSIDSRTWCLSGKFDWASFPPLNEEPKGPLEAKS